jgi:Flp pilus assembly protein TadG
MFVRKNQKNRAGSVTVEFAMVAPIFFVILFGSIEFARVHMIQSAVENACFEGARRGIVPGATSAICKSYTEALLDMAKVKNHTVTVTPASINAATQEITITTVVPLTAENGFGISGFFQDKAMSKSITLPIQKN